MADLVQIEKQINTAIENLDSSVLEKKREAINTFPRLLNTQNFTVNEALLVKNMIEPYIPKLIEIARNEDIGLRKTAAKALSKMDFSPDVYPVLLELFKEGIEFDNFSWEIGKEVITFSGSYNDVKEIILGMLQSSIHYKRMLGLGIIREYSTLIRKGRKSKKTATARKSGHVTSHPKTDLLLEQIQNDWLIIVRNMLRESKSQQLRTTSWKTLQTFTNLEEERELFQKELIYGVLHDILIKFQPNIQVPLQRIAELATPILTEQFQVNNYAGLHIQNVTKELYDDVLKEIIAKDDLTGEYFELEQVFVRKGGKESYSLTSSSYSKKYNCNNCGMPIEKEDKVCSGCNKVILKCNVCKLPISFGEAAGKCSLCETQGHLSHLQEWVKIKGKCPTCQKKLPIEGIVPLSAELEK